MEIIQALILGIVQGITEFLPISSSAHLVLIPRLFNWPEQSTAFDAMLHAGTTISIILYFGKELIEYFSNKSFLIKILLASIPALAFGYLFDDQIDSIFKSNGVIAFMLVSVGILMYIAEQYSGSLKSHLDLKDITFKNAFLIGLSQSIALIRGTSRSGITISAGLFSGMTRADAGKFSFLLTLPVLLAVSGKSFVELGSTNELFSISTLTGFITAAISGYFAIKFLLDYIKKHSLLPFVIYRIILAILILVLL